MLLQRREYGVPPLRALPRNGRGNSISHDLCVSHSYSTKTNRASLAYIVSSLVACGVWVLAPASPLHHLSHRRSSRSPTYVGGRTYYPSPNSPSYFERPPAVSLEHCLATRELSILPTKIVAGHLRDLSGFRVARHTSLKEVYMST